MPNKKFINLLVFTPYSLRLSDNPALYASQNSSLPFVALYLYKNNRSDRLVDSYRLLVVDHLNKMNDHKIVLSCHPFTSLIADLKNKFNIKKVFLNFTPHHTCKLIIDSLQQEKLELEIYECNLLKKWDFFTKKATPYPNFTSFYLNSCIEENFRSYVHNKEDLLQALKVKTKTSTDEVVLSSKARLYPVTPHAAQLTLDYAAMHVVNKYKTMRDVVFEDKTSHLSHFLSTGILSPLQIYQRINSLCRHDENKKSFLRQLAWREYAYYLHYHYPDMHYKDIRVLPLGVKKLLRWNKTKEMYFLKWCQGQTGYPLVDASMVQLNTTGYINNRMRMLVASFLIKSLHVHWQLGAHYFLEKLIDGDEAVNSAGWQWVAGTGRCAMKPYIVLSPDVHVRRFDPHHLFMRMWLRDRFVQGTCYDVDPIINWQDKRTCYLSSLNDI